MDFSAVNLKNFVILLRFLENRSISTFVLKFKEIDSFTSLKKILHDLRTRVNIAPQATKDQKIVVMDSIARKYKIHLITYSTAVSLKFYGEIEKKVLNYIAFDTK